TRRILKPQPQVFLHEDKTPAPVELIHVEGDRLPRVAIGRVITRQEAPYAVGDRLWVRETWKPMPVHAYALPKIVVPETFTYRKQVYDAGGYAVYYAADYGRSGRPLWFPPIHMPRWASRLTLVVTDVKVERLQEISASDCHAEGCFRPDPLKQLGSEV